MAVLVADIARSQQGADFAAMKAGRGGLPLAGLIAQVSFTDTYLDYAVQARAVGLPIGAYWWPTFSADPTQEATTACQRRATAGMVGKLWLDLEEQGVGDVTGWAQRFSATAASVGVEVGYYSTRYWLATYAPGLAVDAEHFWMAGGALYNAVDPDPPTPDPSCALWQYTQYGRLPGTGNVDLNVVDTHHLATIFGGTTQGGLSMADVQTILTRLDQIDGSIGKAENKLEVILGTQVIPIGQQIAAHIDHNSMLEAKAVVDAINAHADQNTMKGAAATHDDVAKMSDELAAKVAEAIQQYGVDLRAAAGPAKAA